MLTKLQKRKKNHKRKQSTIIKKTKKNTLSQIVVGVCVGLLRRTAYHPEKPQPSHQHHWANVGGLAGERDVVFVIWCQSLGRVLSSGVEQGPSFSFRSDSEPNVVDPLIGESCWNLRHMALLAGQFFLCVDDGFVIFFRFQVIPEVREEEMFLV